MKKILIVLFIFLSTLCYTQDSTNYIKVWLIPNDTTLFVESIRAIYGIEKINSFLAKKSKPWMTDEVVARRKSAGFGNMYTLELSRYYRSNEIVEIFEQIKFISNAESNISTQLAWDTIPVPDDTHWGNMWHLDNDGTWTYSTFTSTDDVDIDIRKAWGICEGDTNVLIAVVDNGIDEDHEDLQGKFKDEYSYDYYNDSPSIEPAGSHATGLGGIISATVDNTTGVAGIAGGLTATTGIRLVNLKVGETGSYSFSDEAILDAVDLGAAVINCSFTYQMSYSRHLLLNYARDNGGGSAVDGAILVFAAGNKDGDVPEGRYAEQLCNYPYSNRIFVTGTDAHDSIALDASIASCIAVSAPSNYVYSTYPDDLYTYFIGTSFAAPIVSAILGLIISHGYGEFTHQEAIQLLKDGADDYIYTKNPDVPAGYMGAGRVNAYQSLILADSLVKFKNLKTIIF